MNTSTVPFVLATAAALALAPPSGAQCPVDYINASDAGELFYFGQRLAVSGNHAVIGSTYNDELGPYVGAAYLFEYTDGKLEEVQKVLPPNADYGQHFGQAVAIDGNRALIGSQDNQMAFAAGAGFLYERTAAGWVLDDTLFAANPQHAELLGMAVALEGDRAVLGAPGATLDDGHAIIFEKTASGWVEVDQLRPRGPHVVRGFGQSVEISGDRILVGAFLSGGGAAAYIYDLGPGGWAQTERLVGHDAQNEHGISSAIALDGDRAAYTTQASDPGAAYLFELVNGSWVETEKLVGSGDPGYAFGGSIDIRGERIAIGGIDQSAFGYAQEYVEVFRLRGNDWITETRLTPADGDATILFGSDVALWGDSILIGSPYDYVAPSAITGGVHLFNLAPHTNTTCAATANSSGAPAALSLGCGTTPSELTLSAEPVPNSMGLFYYGVAGVSLPAWDGIRCVGGAVRRLPITQAAGNRLTYSLDMQDPAIALQAGSTWYVQAWFRDAAAAGTGANFSTAVELSLAP